MVWAAYVSLRLCVFVSVLQGDEPVTLEVLWVYGRLSRTVQQTYLVACKLCLTCLKVEYKKSNNYIQTNFCCLSFEWKGIKGQVFLDPTGSKITLMKETERREIKSEEKEMRRRERTNGCTLSFYNGYFGWKKKKRKETVGCKSFQKSG